MSESEWQCEMTDRSIKEVPPIESDVFESLSDGTRQFYRHLVGHD